MDREGGSLENWIIFMNVVCVSSIIIKSDFFFILKVGREEMDGKCEL